MKKIILPLLGVLLLCVLLFPEETTSVSGSDFVNMRNSIEQAFTYLYNDEYEEAKKYFLISESTIKRLQSAILDESLRGVKQISNVAMPSINDLDTDVVICRKYAKGALDFFLANDFSRSTVMLSELKKRVDEAYQTASRKQQERKDMLLRLSQASEKEDIISNQSMLLSILRQRFSISEAYINTLSSNISTLSNYYLTLSNTLANLYEKNKEDILSYSALNRVAIRNTKEEMEDSLSNVLYMLEQNRNSEEMFERVMSNISSLEERLLSLGTEFTELDIRLSRQEVLDSEKRFRQTLYEEFLAFKQSDVISSIEKNIEYLKEENILLKNLIISNDLSQDSSKSFSRVFDAVSNAQIMLARLSNTTTSASYENFSLDKKEIYSFIKEEVENQRKASETFVSMPTFVASLSVLLLIFLGAFSFLYVSVVYRERDKESFEGMGIEEEKYTTREIDECETKEHRLEETHISIENDIEYSPQKRVDDIFSRIPIVSETSDIKESVKTMTSVFSKLPTHKEGKIKSDSPDSFMANLKKDDK